MKEPGRLRALVRRGRREREAREGREGRETEETWKDVEEEKYPSRGLKGR